MSSPAEPRADRLTVSRTMLREQVKDVLLQRIVDGEYGPGERIVETRVAEEFGVSQAPVREALRELEILRLVVSEPFRGARVKEARPEEVLEGYPVRAALEEVGARAAAPRLAGRVGPLADELEGMRAAATSARPASLRRPRRRIPPADRRGERESHVDRALGALHVDLRTKFTLIQRLEDLAEVAESHVPVMEALGRRRCRAGRAPGPRAHRGLRALVRRAC